MITAEQIPPEVEEELCSLDAWRGSASEARAAIAAALNAWPGAEVHNFDGWTHAEGLVLPLTQQGARDD